MKTTVWVPDDLFDAAEELRARLSLSRSKLYTRALAAYVRAEGTDDVTERLNRVYASEPSSLDPLLERMQRDSLPPPW